MKKTLKEVLLSVYTPEEVDQLKLAEGVTLDDEIEHETVEFPFYMEKIVCDYFGHQWYEVNHMLHGIGKRQCSICGKAQESRFYIWRDIKTN